MKNLIFGILSGLFILGLVSAAYPEMWQPPHHDDTMIGVGTDDEPLGVDTTDIVATKHYADSVAGEGGGGASYLIYTALLTQTGTDAPVATVLENTLGSVSFEYQDVGSYIINCTDCFTVNETAIMNPVSMYGSSTLYFNAGSTSAINISSIVSDELANDNGILNGSSFKYTLEIRVYQ